MSEILDIEALKNFFISQLNELRDFHFSFFNPLFWIFFIAVLVILVRLWEFRKSFSFCVTVAVILLLTTRVEELISRNLVASGEAYTPFFIRAVSLFIISVILIYFIFIRDS